MTDSITKPAFFLTQSDVTTALSQCQHWEDKYRQVILWGKQLPKMDDEIREQAQLVDGCESTVWLKSDCDKSDSGNDVWTFDADSDARIVRGLIAVVLAAVQAKTSAQILALDFDDYFEQVGLLSHLSDSRNQGIRAIVDSIRSQAR